MKKKDREFIEKVADKVEDVIMKDCPVIPSKSENTCDDCQGRLNDQGKHIDCRSCQGTGVKPS